MTYTYLESRAKSLEEILKLPIYNVTDEKFIKAIVALGEAVTHCTILLSNYTEHTYAGTQNVSGDEQLHLDLDCDEAIFEALRQSQVYRIAASEETPTETVVGKDGFCIGFDPLDGSSIIDSNFSVGGIFGIWPPSDKGILNRTGREQIFAGMAVYGPRTTFCLALTPQITQKKENIVFEITLVNDRTNWVVSHDVMHIQKSGKIFAPGNLRASNDNAKYKSLIEYWMKERYTLRYTGGMVPDIYHILVKNKGVFSNVSSEKAKAKLRLAYEVAPIGLIIECAGGATTHEFEDKSVLDIEIKDLDQRLGLCLGSSEEVAKYKQVMFGS